MTSAGRPRSPQNRRVQWDPDFPLRVGRDAEQTQLERGGRDQTVGACRLGEQPWPWIARSTNTHPLFMEHRWVSLSEKSLQNIAVGDLGLHQRAV